MKTVGIIAELNPFHNGHAYLIQEAKERTGADYTVVVMSGNFLQRGEPAALDKYLRTRAALLGGADIVIELPVCIAVGNAKRFCEGAVSLLSRLHVDTLCFGSECGELSRLQEAAEISLSEPEPYKEILAQGCKAGLSYPAARAAAMEACTNGGITGTFLAAPNNILGISYLEAIRTQHSSLQPLTVKRRGEDYHSDTLSVYASASALRKALSAEAAVSERLEKIMTSVPPEVLPLLTEALRHNEIVTADDFSSMLFYKLLSCADSGYDTFLDVPPYLSDRIAAHLESYTTFTEFSSRLKFRSMTQTAINRSLLHILLGLTKKDGEALPLYARVLGFKRESKGVFSAFNRSTLPLVTVLADAPSFLSKKAQRQLSQDVFAAHLYENIRAQKSGSPMVHEYRRKLLVV